MKSWLKIDGEKLETVADFIFLGSKITVDSENCSHTVKTHLLLGRKAMTNIKKPETSLCQQRCVKSKLWFFQYHVWMWELDHSGIYLAPSSAGIESTCNSRDTSSIPGSGSSPGEGIGYSLQYSWAFLVAQMVKNPLAMWETWVWSLGWKDLLRKAWQPAPVLLPGESPWTEKLGGYSPWHHKESDMTKWLSTAQHRTDTK